MEKGTWFLIQEELNQRNVAAIRELADAIEDGSWNGLRQRIANILDNKQEHPPEAVLGENKEN